MKAVLSRILDDAFDNDVYLAVDDFNNQMVIYVHNIKEAWQKRIGDLILQQEPAFKQSAPQWQHIHLPPWKMTKTELDELVNKFNAALLENSKSTTRTTLHERN